MHAPLERRSPLVGLSAALIGALLAFATSAASADAPSIEALTAMGEAVRGTDAAARTEAIAAFGALSEDAFPALEARVLAMRRERRTAEEGYRAIDDFGRAVGATGPNQDVDVVRGLTLVLDRETTAVHRRVAERVLVLRALERIGTARAVIAMLPLLTADMATYRWYARHLVRRMGRVTAAALVLAAQHPASDVDLFAGWAFAELGITDAGHAVQDQTADSLAEILRAYSGVKHLGAMPVVASFVGDDRAVVRAAAHEGMLAYAENGIWQLRALHQSRIGRPAGEGATFRDLLARLETHAEDRRTAPFRARIALAEQAFEAGRLDEAVRLARDVEARAQSRDAVARLAPIHAAAADQALSRGDLDGADAAFRRALVLDPNHASAPTWTTRRTEIDTARLARLGVEPWPDAPRLAPTRPVDSMPSRAPFALAGLGVFLLALPRLRRLASSGLARIRVSRIPVIARPRMPDAQVFGRYARVLSTFLQNALPSRVTSATSSQSDFDEVSAMPIHERVIERASAPSPEASANEARTRLSRAAEAARARLGATGASVPPAAPIVLEAIERAVVRAPLDERAEEPAHNEQVVEDAHVAEVAEETLPGLLESASANTVAETIPTMARSGTHEPEREPEHASERVPVSARHERPRRRASLSPELVFGTGTKVPKRNAR